MRYLTDRRAEVREDPRLLLPSARSIICLGKVYNWPAPYSTALSEDTRAWVSRYAWGDDYHDVMREGMTRLVESLGGGFESKICVDTAPLLERTYARLAGLGWIGRNTCLINQQLGSWVFLGEILTSLDLEPDTPPPDRCGTCTRCIEACPTEAIVPFGNGYTVDSRLCISYLTIELRGEIPEDRREGMGPHIFGCDICQDVCPWNRRAAVTTEDSPAEFAPRPVAPDLSAASLHCPRRSFGTCFAAPRSPGPGTRDSCAMSRWRWGTRETQALLEPLSDWHSEDPVVANPGGLGDRS